MTLEMDRFGIPLFMGNPEQLDEYRERAFDLYFGRAGRDSEQGATAVNLRGGLAGAAYEAVREIPHQELMTKDKDGKPSPAGVEILVSKLEQVLRHERVVRANELFDKLFYNKSCWRQSDETMGDYCLRRRRA